MAQNDQANYVRDRPPKFLNLLIFSCPISGRTIRVLEFWTKGVCLVRQRFAVCERSRQPRIQPTDVVQYITFLHPADFFFKTIWYPGGFQPDHAGGGGRSNWAPPTGGCFFLVQSSKIFCCKLVFVAKLHSFFKDFLCKVEFFSTQSLKKVGLCAPRGVGGSPTS